MHGLRADAGNKSNARLFIPMLSSLLKVCCETLKACRETFFFVPLPVYEI